MELVSAPVRFVIDITYRCNMHCTHCHAKAGEVAPRLLENELTTTEVTDLLKELDEMKVFDITITGGEPILRSDLIEIIRYSRNLNFSTLTLITNGSLVSEETAKSLLHAGLNQIRVSLDGLESVNDEIRGPGNFEKATKGIENLLKFFPSLKILTVLTRKNYKNFPELTE